MGYQLLPDSFQPPMPTEDMELTAANVLKLYDELREWHKTKTEHALDKHNNMPSYVLGELAQLRALLEIYFGQNYRCTAHKCMEKKSFSEYWAALHADRYISPILWSGGQQFTKEPFPKACDDKKYCCPHCKRPIDLRLGFPHPYGNSIAVPIEGGE